MIGEYSAIVNLQSSNLGRELRADNTLVGEEGIAK